MRERNEPAPRQRFRQQQGDSPVVEAAAGQGRMLSDLTPDEQEALWQKAKQEER